jgi:hypothetical protein
MGDFKGVRLWDMGSIRDYILNNSSDDFDYLDKGDALAA